MKIVVDEMPAYCSQCLFSNWEFDCTLTSFKCNPDNCRHLTDANTIRKDSIELFTKKLLKQPVVDKSVIRRISEQSV